MARTRRNPKAGVKTGALLGVGATLVGLHLLCKAASKPHRYSQRFGPFGEIKRLGKTPDQPAANGG